MHHEYELLAEQATASFQQKAEPKSAEPALQAVRSFPRRRARSDCVLLGQDRRGNWVAVDRDGRCGGLFVSKEAARAYALIENGNRADAVETVPGLELRLRPPSPTVHRLPQSITSDEI
jgi:hypothetical protein